MKAISVIFHEILSIMTKKPIICTKLDTIVDKDWFNDCTRVSTSLVNLERISP